MSTFVHLHVHTQFSILDGASNLNALIKRAMFYDMPALAMTDHGNLYGAKEFLNTINKFQKKEVEKAQEAEAKGEVYTPKRIKPILGCEMYLARRSRFDKEKEDRSGTHLIVLAKNLTGYKNLIRLSSFSYIEGFYSKPRIDKELLFSNKEGLIISSACIAGDIPRAIRAGDLKLAGEFIAEYKEQFGEDFYLELQRHPTSDPTADHTVFPEQQKVNEALIRLSKDYDVKCIATNDVHFVAPEDADAHDRLICINTNSQVDDLARLRYTKQEWLKSPEEMQQLFSDFPEALANTLEIADKIEVYSLDREAVMPEFPIPAEYGTIDKFRTKIAENELLAEFEEKNFNRMGGVESVIRIKFETDYLKHLVYLGAEKRYGKIVPEETIARIEFELDTIKKMGYPGYFLIVQDLIAAARNMGISVGPGRGSAAGSVVSYCLGITDIDPLKYNLLFERFLNPDRISMPDIDIDFDEDGRDKILLWVADKYGRDKVANIITFGKLQAKSAIKDVARVQKLPLSEANRLTKLIPDGVKIELEKAYELSPELRKEKESGNPLVMDVLKYAETLEGSVRQTGLHACGVIICRDPLIEHIPICINKESDLLVTQYDGHFLEEVGMLKMDFLGLRTLSIIKDCVDIIRESRGIEVDVDTIPLDDKVTYELYTNGLTTGVFQFESEGMRKYLRDLKPNRFEDLIAMNALYRPGPMDYIPKFIARKHGREKILYDLPEMEEFLHDTYGITVYQEQVMLLSQKLAGFTKGEADNLRKAMGKKVIALLNSLKDAFMKGCANNGHKVSICEKIWTDWEAFASYAFNKSHSTCYAFLSYKTAYLKAHFPAEFMAANLSRNLDNIKEITKLMDACRRMKIQILGPDVNESQIRFTVNPKGDVRFGLGAIKGLGTSVAQAIIEERKQNGNYSDIYHFIERVPLNSVNKRSIEALALAGAFDGFREVKRHLFFAEGTEASFTETLIRYGSKIQQEKNNVQQTLFGGTNAVEINKPIIPDLPEWNGLHRMNKEREHIGIYLSEHPLDPFRHDLGWFCTNDLAELRDFSKLEGRDVVIAGIVTESLKRTTSKNQQFGTVTIEDFSDSFTFSVFSNDYVEFSKYFEKEMSLLIRGKIQRRINSNKNELEFKVTKVMLLNEARKELLRKITLDINVSDITEEMVKELSIVLSESKGKTQINFRLFESNEKIMVNMFSRKHSVDVDEKLITFLDENPEINYKVN